jgi:pectate lyase
MDVKAQPYLQAVREYCDKVLAIGMDVYGPKATPLLVDGVDVETLQPVRWRYQNLEWIPANLANHQNLFRTLCGLSALTGDGRYKQAAVDAMRYGIDHLRSPSGLLYWGGHTTYDALSDDWAGRLRLRKHPTPHHEFMNHLPYYSLMWEIDPDYTRRFLGALWSGHVVEWARLDIDRHAPLAKALPEPDWNTPYAGGPVFFVSKGRSFMPIADDLIYAAATLYRLAGNEQALAWAKRLAHRYVETRDPTTGLMADMFSHKEDPDRAHTQFGDALPGHVVSEATMWSPHTCIVADRVWMMTGQELGPPGQEFVQWAMEDLRAIAQVGYDPQRKVFQGLMIDGTNVEKVLKTRGGYFGAEGTPICDAQGVWPEAFLTYALAARISREPFFWDMARQFAQVRGLGDIGQCSGDPPAWSDTRSTEAAEILGLIHLFHLTGRPDYLDQACRIADNILAHRRVEGLFVADPNLQHARLDSEDALILLNLYAAMTGQDQAVPACWFSASYFACEWEDGQNYIYDYNLYRQHRKSATTQPDTGQASD